MPGVPLETAAEMNLLQRHWSSQDAKSARPVVIIRISLHLGPGSG